MRRRARRVRLRRRERRRRESLTPSPKQIYTPHSLRMATRRVACWRAVAPEIGVTVVGREHLESLFRRGRAAGLLGRRRLVAIRVTLDPTDVEYAMLATGARSIDELVVAALLATVLPKAP